MFDSIRQSSFRVRWQLRSIHKIIQYKDGCVYRTRSLGIISCTEEYVNSLRASNPDIIVGSIPTHITRAVNL